MGEEKCQWLNTKYQALSPQYFIYPHSNPATKLLPCPLKTRGSKGFGWCGALSQLAPQTYWFKECLCFFIQQFWARDCTGLGSTGMRDVLVSYCSNEGTKQTPSQAQWLTTRMDFLRSRVGQQLNRDFCYGPRDGPTPVGPASVLASGLLFVSSQSSWSCDYPWHILLEVDHRSTRDKANHPNTFKASADITSQSKFHAQI